MSIHSVPAGWRAVLLADIVTPSRPKKDPQSVPHLPFVGMRHVEAETTRLTGTVPAGSMRSAGVHFQAGDVLYGRLRPYLNKVHLATFEGLGSAEFIVLSESESVDARFLLYRLNAADFVAFASGLNEGDRPRVDFRQIGQFALMLPPPAEQRRIVAALEEHLSGLDAAVAGMERARERLDAYIAAKLELLVCGVSVDTSRRDKAERNISWRPLREAIAAIDQGWSPRCASEPPADDSKWGVIKTTTIQPMRFDSRESKALPGEIQPRVHLEIRAGDLLVTRKGPRSRAGVAAAVKTTRPRLMICDTVYRIRLREDIARPHFLAIAMSTPTVAAAIDAAKAGISESGVSLTHDRLGAVESPFPPLDVQEAIEDEVDRYLDIVERMNTSLDVQLARAKRLRQSILKRAFEGKLVPQDPNDEPASVLLERIHAERAAAPALRRAGRRVASRR